MKKNLFIILLLLAATIFYTGCQRDDICPEATETTLPLSINFFDSTDTETPKPPVNLTVRAQSRDIIYGDVFNTSEIKIPLRTDADITTYIFTINTPSAGAEEDNSNSDVVIFSYGRKEIYINRACSYKVQFTGLTATIDDTGDNNLWIKGITVNNENDTIPSISIYH